MGNVYVNRVLDKFGLKLDEADAVAFAETILESTKGIFSHEIGNQSVPAKRELNLALCYLNTKYPVQCCGSKYPNEMCEDCPMTPWDDKCQSGYDDSPLVSER